MNLRTFFSQLCYSFLLFFAHNAYTITPTPQEVARAQRVLQGSTRRPQPDRSFYALRSYIQVVSRPALQQCLDPNIMQRVLRKPEKFDANQAVVRTERNNIYTNMGYLKRLFELRPFVKSDQEYTQSTAIKTLFYDLKARYEKLEKFYQELHSKMQARQLQSTALVIVSPDKRGRAKQIHHETALVVRSPASHHERIKPITELDPKFFIEYFSEYAAGATSPKASQFAHPLTSIIGHLNGEKMVGGLPNPDASVPRWIYYAFPRTNASLRPRSNKEVQEVFAKNSHLQEGLKCSFRYFLSFLGLKLQDKVREKRITCLQPHTTHCAGKLKKFLQNRRNLDDIERVFESLMQHGLALYAQILYEFFLHDMDKQFDPTLSRLITEKSRRNWAHICKQVLIPSPKAPASPRKKVEFKSKVSAAKPTPPMETRLTPDRPRQRFTSFFAQYFSDYPESFSTLQHDKKNMCKYTSDYPRNDADIVPLANLIGRPNTDGTMHGGLVYTDAERIHSWIQYAFPTQRKSDYNPKAPCSDAATHNAFVENKKLRNALKCSFKYYLGFMGLHLDETSSPGSINIIPLSPYDYKTRMQVFVTSGGGHNLARASRILVSLSEHGLLEYAQAFYAFLVGNSRVGRAKVQQPSSSIAYWDRQPNYGTHFSEQIPKKTYAIWDASMGRAQSATQEHALKDIPFVRPIGIPTRHLLFTQNDRKTLHRNIQSYEHNNPNSQ